MTTRIVTFKLPVELVKVLDEMAYNEGTSRNAIVRKALQEYVEHNYSARIRKRGSLITVYEYR